MDKPAPPFVVVRNLTAINRSFSSTGVCDGHILEFRERATFQVAMWGVLGTSVLLVTMCVVYPDANQSWKTRLFGPTWPATLPFLVLLLTLAVFCLRRAYLFGVRKKTLTINLHSQTARLTESWPSRSDLTTSLTDAFLLECVVQFVWRHTATMRNAIMFCIDDKYYVLAISDPLSRPTLPLQVQELGLRWVVDSTMIIRTNAMY